MSGRMVIFAMAAFAIVMSVFFYRTLKSSPKFKELAVEQMLMEFKSYTKNAKSADKLPVANDGTAQFFVDLNSDWKFEIQDKTLVVFPPPFISEPPGRSFEMPEAKAAAYKGVHDAVQAWLIDKYHSDKDLLIEVRQ
ncbi:MAG: hypothetical protein ACAH59_12865 [Pseudobdellovibrionaceae bacterium]